MYEAPKGTVRLEQIILKSQFQRGHGRISCSGGGCDGVFSDWRDAHNRMVQVGLAESAKKLWRHFVPAPSVLACSTTSFKERGEGHPRDTTSHSPDEERRLAAIDIVQNTIRSDLGGNSPFSDGEYSIVFSDGGTQTLHWLAAGPGGSRFIEPSDLVRGDGESKCK